MKLDKIKFARLVAMITSEYHHMHDDFVQALDDLIDFQEPVYNVGTNQVNPSRVDKLLQEIMSPDGFIPAIKVYRDLTGSGLKEAKEAIERYRNIPKFPAKDTEPATLGDILGKVNTKERSPVNFDKFEG